MQKPCRSSECMHRSEQGCSSSSLFFASRRTYALRALYAEPPSARSGDTAASDAYTRHASEAVSRYVLPRLCKLELSTAAIQLPMESNNKTCMEEHGGLF